MMKKLLPIGLQPKARRIPKGSALWSRIAMREIPLRQELRRGESSKTIRWIVLPRGEPCDRGLP